MNDEDTTPREHRCVELNLKGQPCGLKAVQGRKRCYIHGLYWELNDGRSTIDVPLLEDEDSILFVYSQVARALAQGSMPPANASGILRCCRGAQRLLEEKQRHERFAAKMKTGVRKQETEDSDTAAHPEHQPAQADATVPANLENSASAGEDEIRVTPAEDAGSADHESTEPEPQPWTLPPDRKIIPPPQFADARKKFDDNLARSEGDRTKALIARDREIRARGGTGRDGLINDIRDQF